jgi:hypothetical protein
LASTLRNSLAAEPGILDRELLRASRAWVEELLSVFRESAGGSSS